MGNEAWSKIQLHENLELKNMMAIYTLNLRTNLEHFLESILYILFIFSKLGKLKVQYFKQCTNQSWNEEVKVIWRKLHKVKGSFRNDLEIQLMNSKSILKWHQFRIHPLPLWCFASSTLSTLSIMARLDTLQELFVFMDSHIDARLSKMETRNGDLTFSVQQLTSLVVPS